MLLFNNIDIDNTKQIVSQAQTDEQVLIPAGQMVNMPAGINITNDYERDIAVTFTYKKQGGFSLSSPLFSNKAVSPGKEYTISQLAQDEFSINPCMIELFPGENIMLQDNTNITNDTDSHLTIVYNGWGRKDLRVFDPNQDRALLSVSIIELGESYLLSELIEKDGPVCNKPANLEKPLPKE